MDAQDFLGSQIPESFFKLAWLRQLSVASSSVSGTISPALDKLTNLEVLDLSRTLLHVETPASLGTLANNMEEFRSDHNLLSGTIPTSVVSLGTVEKGPAP